MPNWEFLALQRTSFIGMLDQTARMTAEGLEAEYCKVMEYIPAENRLLVRAGVGWEPGIVGSASVGADLASPAGYALRTGKPVISNHLENERRFRTPELLVEHGIRRAMNVICRATARRSGCWKWTARPKASSASTTSLFYKAPQTSSEWRSSNNDINENCKPRLIVIRYCSRKSTTASRTAYRWFRLCFNSKLTRLTIPALTKQKLNDASVRVNAVGRAYERLTYNADYENIDLIEYLREIINDLEPTVAPCKIQLDAPKEIQIAADRSILVGLIMNELVSNAGKYAYPDCRSRSGCACFNRTRIQFWCGSGTRESVYLLVLTRRPASGSARASLMHFQSNWGPN